MRTSLIVSVLAASLLSVTGCAFDDDGFLGGDQTLYQRLGHREYLGLEQPSLVGVAAYDRDGAPLPCVQPTVADGTAVLRATADGWLIVEGLALDLTDITIEPGVVFPDAPMQLTDIHLRLGTQIAFEPEWTADGTRASGAGRGDLLMDWALLDDDGDVLPLATQKIRDAELAVAVQLTPAGDVIADVTSAVDGTFWDFSAIELADFSMVVNATSAAYQ